ncbi:hypothetical protein SMICM17S_07985 [Streptomyces microflavus]
MQIGQPRALRRTVRARVHLALHLRELARVHPRPDDQLVPPGHRILGAHGPVQLDRAEGEHVVPAAHREGGHAHLAQAVVGHRRHLTGEDVPQSAGEPLEVEDGRQRPAPQRHFGRGEQLHHLRHDRPVHRIARRRPALHPLQCGQAEPAREVVQPQRAAELLGVVGGRGGHRGRDGPQVRRLLHGGQPLDDRLVRGARHGHVPVAPGLPRGPLDGVVPVRPLLGPVQRRPLALRTEPAPGVLHHGRVPPVHALRRGQRGQTQRGLAVRGAEEHGGRGRAVRRAPHIGPQHRPVTHLHRHVVLDEGGPAHQGVSFAAGSVPAFCVGPAPRSRERVR